MKVDNPLKIPYPLVYWSNYDAPAAPCIYVLFYLHERWNMATWILKGNGWVNIPHMEHLVIILVGSYGSWNSWPILLPIYSPLSQTLNVWYSIPCIPYTYTFGCFFMVKVDRWIMHWVSGYEYIGSTPHPTTVTTRMIFTFLGSGIPSLTFIPHVSHPAMRGWMRYINKLTHN